MSSSQSSVADLRPPPPLFWVKPKNSQREEKPARQAKKKKTALSPSSPHPLHALAQGLDPPLVLALFWEDTAIALSPLICSFSRNGDSFIPRGKTHLLPLSLYSSHPCLLHVLLS